MALGKGCVTLGCDNDATANTSYCKNCGAGINSWAKRRPAEVLERRRKLRMYDSRMGAVVKKKGE